MLQGTGTPRCAKSYIKTILLNVLVHPENRDKEPQKMLHFLEVFF